MASEVSVILIRIFPSFQLLNQSICNCRDELYKECVAALQGGLLLSGKDFDAIKKALQEAFENVDMKLLNRLVGWLMLRAKLFLCLK